MQPHPPPRGLRDQLKSVSTQPGSKTRRADYRGPASPVATRTKEPDSGDADYRNLLAALGHDPVPIDVLAQRTGLTVPSLSSMLLLMELDGRVVAENGRYSRLQPENVPQRAGGNAQAEDG